MTRGEMNMKKMKIQIMALYTERNGDEITTDLNKAPTKLFERELKKMSAFDLQKELKNQTMVMEELVKSLSFQEEHKHLIEHELKRKTTCTCGDTEDQRILDGTSPRCPVHNRARRPVHRKRLGYD
jgi:hypothetical protein